MNTRSIKLLVAALLGMLLATLCFAQDPAAPVSTFTLPPDAQNFILVLLGKLMVNHPWVATLIAGIGSMRLWAKPLFSFVHQVVELTPGKMDDDCWAKGYDFFTRNPVGKFLAYLLDWLGSVKITPPGAEARPKPVDQ